MIPQQQEAMKQRAQLADAIASLVSSTEAFYPKPILCEGADLERLGLAEKVDEVRNKWLERTSSILEQFRELRGRCKDPFLAQKLDDATMQVEAMRKPLLDKTVKAV